MRALVLGDSQAEILATETELAAAGLMGAKRLP